MKSRIQKHREKVYCILDGTPCIHCDKCEHIDPTPPKKSNHWFAKFLIIIVIFFILYLLLQLVPYFILMNTDGYINSGSNNYNGESGYMSNKYVGNQYGYTNTYKYSLKSITPTLTYDFLMINKSI